MKKKTIFIEIGITEFDKKRSLVCIIKNNFGEIINVFGMSFYNRNDLSFVSRQIKNKIELLNLASTLQNDQISNIHLSGVKHFFVFTEIDSGDTYEIHPTINNTELIININKELMKIME